MLRRSFLGATGGVLLAEPSESAHNVLTPAEKKAGWQLLFDGVSLKGWDDPGRRDPPADSWTVRDGCIQAVAHPKIREDLLTVDSFEDFDLVFDWRVAPGSNSGVKYLVQERVMLDYGRRPADIKKFEDYLRWEMVNRKSTRAQIVGKVEEYSVAFEFQVIDDSGHEDARRGAKYQAGALYSLVGASRRMARPVGEFNQGRIVKTGDRVEHWLNGVKVVDTTLDTPDIRKSLAARWTTDHPVYRMLTTLPKRRAPICLQNHNDEAWFRNIKIRRP